MRGGKSVYVQLYIAVLTTRKIIFLKTYLWQVFKNIYNDTTAG